MASLTRRDAVLEECRRNVGLSVGQTLKVDDPEWDGTDFAHPAWWRGQDDGIQAVVTALNRDLDSSGPPCGCYGSHALTELRNRILDLRDRARALDFPLYF